MQNVPPSGRLFYPLLINAFCAYPYSRDDPVRVGHGMVCFYLRCKREARSFPYNPLGLLVVGILRLPLRPSGMVTLGFHMTNG